ncbi:MAG: hypothetical protein HQL66_00765 [Magnetococcales bacterium]|nr:hypothetical protein [Magnetococcales bacterium]
MTTVSHLLDQAGGKILDQAGNLLAIEFPSVYPGRILGQDGGRILDQTGNAVLTEGITVTRVAERGAWSLGVSAAVRASYGLRVEAAARGICGASYLSAAARGVYGLGVAAAATAQYGTLTSVAQAMRAEWACTSPVRASATISYPLLALNPVRKSMTIRYAVLGDTPPLMPDGGVSIIHLGIPIR